MNDFLDNNNCLNINEEFQNKKNDFNLGFVKELKDQLGSVDYLFISHQWKDLVKSENTTIVSISSN